MGIFGIDAQLIACPRDNVYFFFGMIGFATLMWFTMFKTIGYLFAVLSPTYRSLSKTDKVIWDSRAVSTINAVVTFVEWYVTLVYVQREATLLNYSSCAITGTYMLWEMVFFTGYLIYDVSQVIYRKELWDVPIIIHHSCGTLVFMVMSYYHYGYYYLGMMSVFEGTTLFINNIWFFSKCGLRNHWIYTLNGILVWVFWLALRVYPTTVYFYTFYVDIYSLPSHLISQQFKWGVGIWMFTISALQYFWFIPITKGVLRALNGDSKSSKTKLAGQQKSRKRE